MAELRAASWPLSEPRRVEHVSHCLSQASTSAAWLLAVSAIATSIVSNTSSADSRENSSSVWGGHYGKPIAWAFEPHVAEQILRDMLAEGHVEVFLHSQLAGVTKAGSQID